MIGDASPVLPGIAELRPAIERIAGHAVNFELLYWPIAGPDGECCGGYLNVGTAHLWLDADQAINIADRVRAAIDQAVVSNFPSPIQNRRLS